MIFPTIEVLSEAVKKEIARQVADKISVELRSPKYIENAYIFKIAEEIASRHFRLEFVRNENDSFSLRYRVGEK